MYIIKLIFWTSLFIVIYSYVLYSILVWFLIFCRKIFFGEQNKQFDSQFLPSVSLVIATYNEEIIIRKKIQNSLELDYPGDKLKIYFVTDGSTDKTNDILKLYPSVNVLYKPERKGKVAAINHAMEFVDSPFVIFCDANTFLNKSCIKEIVKHYKDEKTGAVAGEKKVINTSKKNSAVGSGEGLYWKYESLLKKLDARFYTVVGAAGELFSMRTALYKPMDANILLDDFMISMNICKMGYTVMYEPAAFAMETPSLNIRDEQKRKIRISAGGFQSIYLLRDLLNIFKYGKLSFQYISHRVLRWTICPLLLPVIFILNIILCYYAPATIYYFLGIMQIIFYLGAFIGWAFAQKNIKSKVFYIPYYFLFMNISLYKGFLRFIKNEQTVLWDKAGRKADETESAKQGN
ncbi:MAG: glycosyltransferase family 2 protein [Bacteroidota bacterium]|nr:glycosyltransferase family 2 protein [Bacteroidota bacterium]